MQAELLEALLDFSDRPEDELRKLASQDPAGDSQPNAPADQFACHLIWLASEPMLPERSYRGAGVGQRLGVQVTDLTYEREFASLP